jgi:hypothetical protein
MTSLLQALNHLLARLFLATELIRRIEVREKQNSH